MSTYFTRLDGFRKMVWTVGHMDRNHWLPEDPSNAPEVYVANQFRATNPTIPIRLIVWDPALTHYGHLELPRHKAVRQAIALRQRRHDDAREEQQANHASHDRLARRHGVQTKIVDRPPRVGKREHEKELFNEMHAALSGVLNWYGMVQRLTHPPPANWRATSHLRCSTGWSAPDWQLRTPSARSAPTSLTAVCGSGASLARHPVANAP